MNARTVLPAPGEPRPFAAPEIHEREIAGLRVVVAPRRTIPLIGAQLTLRRGSACDPPETAGLSAHAATMLDYGPRRLSSEDFGEALDAVGGNFSGGAGRDSFSVGFSAMRRLFAPTLRLAAETIREPGLREADLERLRARYVSDIRLSASTAASLGRQVLSRAIYGAHPYGMPYLGTLATNAAITRAGVERLLGERLRPAGATLVFVGDCSPEDAFAYVEEAFGDWPTADFPADAADVPLARDLMPTTPRTILVHLPDSGRSAVYVGRAALARDDADYLEATVLNAIFSGYSGRLNREIRVKRGLSYGASSNIGARLRGGSLTASTLVDHAKVGETVAVMHDTFGEIVATPPSADELRTRKAMLRGAFGRGVETVGGLAGAIGGRVVYGLPLDELRTYLDRLDAVTAEDVTRVAARIAANPAHTVIVGDADRVAPQLAPGSFERFEAEEIDLRTPTLR